jgi:molybdopterin/thiamine biosynthesis adenylyltransferase
MKTDEHERYKRQLMSPGFTEEHQQRLRDSHILLAGIGGLGGAIAYGLAAAGVGKITLVHSGGLTESNLNRQTLMSDAAVGACRVELARDRLLAFSRFVDVAAHDIPITDETLHPLMEGVDLLIDARHNFPERKTLNQVAMAHDIPFLFAAMDHLDCQLALFRKNITGCLACLYPEDPPDWDPFGFAVFGATAHAIGAMAAMEAIKYVSGYQSVSNALVTLDMRTYQTRNYLLHKAHDCPVCVDSSINALQTP